MSVDNIGSEKSRGDNQTGGEKCPLQRDHVSKAVAEPPNGKGSVGGSGLKNSFLQWATFGGSVDAPGQGYQQCLLVAALCSALAWMLLPRLLQFVAFCTLVGVLGFLNPSVRRRSREHLRDMEKAGLQNPRASVSRVSIETVCSTPKAMLPKASNSTLLAQATALDLTTSVSPSTEGERDTTPSGMSTNVSSPNRSCCDASSQVDFVTRVFSPSFAVGPLSSSRQLSVSSPPPPSAPRAALQQAAAAANSSFLRESQQLVRRGGATAGSDLSPRRIGEMRDRVCSVANDRIADPLVDRERSTGAVAAKSTSFGSLLSSSSFLSRCKDNGRRHGRQRSGEDTSAFSGTYGDTSLREEERSQRLVSVFSQGGRGVERSEPYSRWHHEERRRQRSLAEDARRGAAEHRVLHDYIKGRMTPYVMDKKKGSNKAGCGHSSSEGWRTRVPQTPSQNCPWGEVGVTVVKGNEGLFEGRREMQEVVQALHRNRREPSFR